MRFIQCFIIGFFGVCLTIGKNTTTPNETTNNDPHALSYLWPIQSLWGLVGKSLFFENTLRLRLVLTV